MDYRLAVKLNWWAWKNTFNKQKVIFIVNFFLHRYVVLLTIPKENLDGVFCVHHKPLLFGSAPIDDGHVFNEFHGQQFTYFFMNTWSWKQTMILKLYVMCNMILLMIYFAMDSNKTKTLQKISYLLETVAPCNSP